MLDSPAPPRLAGRCHVQQLNEASDPLIGAAVLQLIEQLEAHKVEVAEVVEVGDALEVDVAKLPPRVLAAAPRTARGPKWLHVDECAGEQLVK